MDSVTTQQINSTASHLLEQKHIFSLSISKVMPADHSDSSCLVFASSVNLFNTGKQNGAKAYIVTEDVYVELQKQNLQELQIWTTKNIQQAMTVVLPLFDKKQQFLRTGIHPSAVIHPTAKVSKSAHIGANTVIDAHAVVDDETLIYPNSYIGPYCEIGKRCHISSHVTIGADGFGFFTDKNFKHHKIPQIGKVVIEDDCEFGSFCAVDRATLTETRIKKGSKFDNFCHIAHNVQFGENALVAAGFIVAGSTIIGKNLMTSGGVHVLGHLKVADNVILSARAGALQSIEEPGMYGGFPLETHKESIKTMMTLPQIKKIKKQVNKLFKHLNLKDED